MEEIGGLAEFLRPLLDAALQPLVHVAKADLHPSERLRQLPHLVLPVNGNFRIEVALADLPRGLRQVLQRPRDAADKPYTQHDRGNRTQHVAPGEVLATDPAAVLRECKIRRQTALDQGRQEDQHYQFVRQFQAAHGLPYPHRA